MGWDVKTAYLPCGRSLGLPGLVEQLAEGAVLANVIIPLRRLAGEAVE